MEQRIETAGNTGQKNQNRILVIDDDPEMRLAMHIRLKASNYAVIFAVDGVSGIAEARYQRPDVILLDLGIPVGDGYIVMERLQANDKLACIPVIVVSGRDRVANHDRSLKAGARIFLQKPVRNSDLLLAIDHVLGVKPPPPAPVIYDVGEGHRTAMLDGLPHPNLFKRAA